uniref:non-specific serine/threonine protein kinase n=1 Tax=Timema poppense TaxID=170557 RepID=A0A7R9CSU8_TIMPO|nr:unnamed protein product [Timema poppensis]
MEGQYSDVEESSIPDSDVQRIADKIDKLNTSETKCDFSNHLGTESEDSKEDWSDGEIYDFNFKSANQKNKEHTLGGSYNDSTCNVNNSKLTNYQPPEKLFKRYSNKINVEKYEGPSLPGHAANFLIESGKKLDADRFRRGYCRHNPRKMVRTWAEKEMRNLVRMFTAGMSVPEPILLRSHVLLMDFIGKDGWPAPKYHNSQIYIIDVSQSVEHDHPHALDFLRKDCTNITEFFKRKEVATMTIKELFDFITDPTIREVNIEEYLDKVSERAAARTIEVTSEECTAQEQIDEEVFKNAFIPKRLAEVASFCFFLFPQVVDIERDIRNVKSGKDKELVYKTITGLKGDLSGPQTKPEILEKTTSSGEEEEDSSERENSSEDDSKFVNSSRPRDESPDSKKPVSPRLKTFLVHHPRVTIKRPPNLHNILVHPKLPEPKRIREEKQTTKGSYPCGSTCGFHLPVTSFKSKVTKLEYEIPDYYNCETNNFIYQLQCRSCDAEYIVLTTGSLRQRMNNQSFDTNHKDPDKPVPIHAGTHNQDFQTCYTTPKNS